MQRTSDFIITGVVTRGSKKYAHKQCKGVILNTKKCDIYHMYNGTLSDVQKWFAPLPR